MCTGHALKPVLDSTILSFFCLVFPMKVAFMDGFMDANVSLLVILVKTAGLNIRWNQCIYFPQT